MSLISPRFCLAAAVVGAALAASACTVHETQVPTLSGPSGLGNSIVVSVSPNVLSWDGQSQSLVTVTATNNVGQPSPNVPMRVDITVAGQAQDLGRLSAKSIVTDATGRASVIYTAPAPPQVNGVPNNGIPNNGKKIDIQVTPTDATFNSNFDNTTPRTASIQLMPPGIISAPPSMLVPSFVVPALNVGDQGVFTAKVVDASGADATRQVVSFQWTFGDGGTASGQSVTHTFTQIGTFPVTLTITDALGSTNFTTQSITIGQGQLPTATFVASPASATPSQQIFFNASSSTAAPGHSILVYAWDFGDGSPGSGVTTSHSYLKAGSYEVVLQVTDDAGRQGTSQQTVQVGTVSGGSGGGSGAPTAAFTVTPATPTHGTNAVFNASASQAASGRTIVSYTWNWGDGTIINTVTPSPVTSHSFPAAGPSAVTLTVTDDQGNQTSITQILNVM
jgi:PKD repeat protein